MAVPRIVCCNVEGGVPRAIVEQIDAGWWWCLGCTPEIHIHASIGPDGLPVPDYFDLLVGHPACEVAKQTRQRAAGAAELN